MYKMIRFERIEAVSQYRSQWKMTQNYMTASPPFTFLPSLSLSQPVCHLGCGKKRIVYCDILVYCY